MINSSKWLNELKELSTLKEVCHKIFNLHFFHDSNPSGPLINRVKYFQIQCWFCRDIKIFKTSRVKLRGVHHTVESDFAVYIIPRSQTPRCASYRGVRLRSVHHTAESDSSVCITPQSHENKLSIKKTLWCASLHGVKLRGVHHTAESITCQNQSTFPLFGHFDDFFYFDFYKDFVFAPMRIRIEPVADSLPWSGYMRIHIIPLGILRSGPSDTV